jgi:hypothetical protein
MNGLTLQSTWTDLAVGMVVAGLGLGVTLPSLGSLAMEVADSRRLGMAAGVNNTFSQTAMSVGIAVYGALLGHQVTQTMTSDLAGEKLSVGQLAHAASSGAIVQATADLPRSVAGVVIRSAHQGFITGLNHLFFIVAGVAFVGSLLSVLFLRTPSRAPE